MSDARQELLENVRAFAADHGLCAESDGDPEMLAKKFLVVLANGVDMDVAYPVIASDIAKLKFRGQGGLTERYRTTKLQSVTCSPEMWEALFATADVSQLRDTKNADLDVYQHFKRDTRDLWPHGTAEWQKALGFYLPAMVQRNAHDICLRVIPDVDRSQLTRAVRSNLTDEEYATGLANVLKAIRFEMADSPEFRMVLREPSRRIEASAAGRQQQQQHEVTTTEIPVWERSESYVPAPAERVQLLASDKPAHQRIAAEAPKALTFGEKKRYRQLAPVKAAMSNLLKTGEHTPPKVAFRGYVQHAYADAPYPESAADAHATRHDPEFQQVLSFIDFMPVGPVMETSEMHDFLATVARHISREAYGAWTDRQAAKKLLTVHGKDWVAKWDPSWPLDEPLKRAIVAHRLAYPAPSKALLDTVLSLEPVSN